MQTEVLEKIDNQKFTVFSIWTPVLRSDNREQAEKSKRILSDSRASHFWDANQQVGKLYKDALMLPSGVNLAWDVYNALVICSESYPTLVTFAAKTLEKRRSTDTRSPMMCV